MHAQNFYNRPIRPDAVRADTTVVLVTDKREAIFYHILEMKPQGLSSSQALEAGAPTEPNCLDPTLQIPLRTMQTKWQNLFSRFQSEYHRCFLLYFINHAHQMFLTRNVHNTVKEQHIKLLLQNDLIVSVGLAVHIKCRSKKKRLFI